MYKFGILVFVIEFIFWVFSMVVVKKFNGILCICIDLKDLNKVLKCSYYLLFIIEDILLDFSCVKVFSIFDVKNGFWYIEFDEESLKFIIFNMFFGRYCWLWLFFGFFFVLEEF